ncbi:MAG: hypothetical protein IMZ61_10760 [Planctomycetes bacterium]|nr:hypothetical protein [Planctomycetota bacterium]
MTQQRHPRKHLKMRRRVYYGTIQSGETGQRFGLEDKSLIAAIESVTVIDKDGWQINGPENLADFGVALLSAARARVDLTPEMPSKKAPLLDDWFEWQDKMNDAGQICTLQDVADHSDRKYETVKKAHEIYLGDHGET